MASVYCWDIETLPAIAAVWGPKQDWIQEEAIIKGYEPSIVCASWMHPDWKRPKTITMMDYWPKCGSIYNDKQLVIDLSEELSKADMLLGQNSSRFDRKMLSTRLSHWDLPPMPPIPEHDVLTQSRKVFKRWSHKLDSRGKYLGLGGKKKISLDVWVAISSLDFGGDKRDGISALKAMATYNRRDVVLLRDVYLKERSFYMGHPNMPILDGVEDLACNTCSSKNLQRRGFERRKSGTVSWRYHCQDCGSWSKDTRMVAKSALRAI